MNVKKKIQYEENISIADLIISFWNNKLLILYLGVFGIFLGLLYSSISNKTLEFKATIETKYPQPSFHYNYLNSLKGIIGERLDFKFNPQSYKNDFNLRLNSLNTLESFIDQNKKIDNFKKFLEKNNITSKQYFFPRFGQNTAANGRDKLDSFYLIYPEYLDGKLFLADYVNYVRDISISNLQNERKSEVNNFIEIYKKNLEISKKIKLENPLALIALETQNYINTNRHRYYEGIKILTSKINYLEEMFKNLDKEIISYQAISSSAFSVPHNFQDKKKYPIIGLFVGIIMSLIIILGKEIIKKKS